MPLIQVKIVEGVFSAAQKQEMIRKLTDTMVSIEGEAMRQVTWVVVEEVKSGSWGIGGEGPDHRRCQGHGGRRLTVLAKDGGGGPLVNADAPTARVSP